MKRHLIRFDILRVIAVLMVIGAHFDTHLPGFLSFANYPLPMISGMDTFLFDGSLAVAIFFLLSGFFSYGTVIGEHFSLKDYYKKRLKRLLFPIWIAWIIGFVFNLFLRQTITIASGWEFIFTIIGFDSYIPTYYSIGTWGIVGEWYTGAIITVIILWPIMRWMMQSRFWLSFVGIIVLQAGVGLLLPEQSIEIQYWRSPLVSLTSFSIGVAAARLIRMDSWRKGNALAKITLMASIVLLGSAFHRVSPLVGIFSFQVIALGYLLMTEVLGEVMHERARNSKLVLVGRGLFKHLSSISYEFYLFQHIAIYAVLGKAAQILGRTNVYPMTIMMLFGSSVLVAYLLAVTCRMAENKIRAAYQRACFEDAAGSSTKYR